MVESNPRPTRIQTPRNNIIAHSIVNKRRARLNPTSVRTQRIKSTPRRVNTTQAPVNYNKIVKEVINEYNAVKALLNLKRKSDANKVVAKRNAERQRKREYYHKRKASMTEAEKEEMKQRRIESSSKKKETMTEAEIEAIKQRKREYYHKKKATTTKAQKEARKKYMKEYKKKRNATMTEANLEAHREAHRKYRREWQRKKRAEQKLRKS